MGGSRVTNPVGPNNKLTGSALGALTVPVVTQIANHLAVSGGKFSGTEAIFVMAGGNDVLYQLGALQAARRLPARRPVRPPVPMPARKPLPRTGRGPGGRRPESCHGGASHRRGRGRRQRGAGATSATSSVPPCRPPWLPATRQCFASRVRSAGGQGASRCHRHGQCCRRRRRRQGRCRLRRGPGPLLIAAMKQAGTELVALVKDKIIANGANYVVVNNLPDVAGTPSGLSKDANTKALINAMVSAFNGELSSGLAGNAKVLLVDVFAVSHDQGVNPGPYGLTNVTETACDLTPAKNFRAARWCAPART
jgi:hypothetical protein